MVILLSAGVFFLGGTTLVESLELNKKIHKNVYIEDIDLSGLTVPEAKKKVDNTIKLNKELKLKFDDKEYILNLNKLGVNYLVDNMIESAYNIGRNENILSNIKRKIKLDLGEDYVIKLKYTFDEKKIDDYVEYIQSEIGIEPTNASIKVENDSIVVKKEKYGRKVDTNRLKEVIMYKIENIYCKENNIPIVELKPKYLYEDLSKIDTVLGTYETYFNPKKLGRVNNIKVAANATNNIIIDPETEFSFNSYTQSNEVRSQMQKAPVIVNGKVEEGLGGGICQVSSTLYNAALYAGLEITNVRNHSIPSAYIDKGRDATVADGNLDLRFKNKFNTHIFIFNKVYDNRIVSVIYGNKEDKKDIEVTTEIVNTVPNKVKFTESKELYEGEKNIKENGRLGYKVNTFRIYKNIEKPIKEFISESYYPPMDKEVIYGTRKKDIYNTIGSQIM